MIGYQYIIDLFTAVLQQSRAIQGRFYVSYRYGAQEINMDNLGQVISEITPGPKYPLSLLAPPNSQFKPSEAMGEWDRYRLIMFFVKTTYYDQHNKVANINVNTRTSSHTVAHDWHDMKRCAVNFLRSLCNLQRHNKNAIFRVPPNQVLVQPISSVGTDRVTGVSIHFDFDLFLGCDLEDYSEYPTTIYLTNDSHPEHNY